MAHMKDYIGAIDFNHTYTFKELMDTWRCSSDVARARIRTLAAHGMTVRIQYRHPNGGKTYRIRNQPKYVFVDDIGNTSIICPACAKAGRKGEHGETVYLTQEQDGDEELFCQACGYWPDAKKVDELQIRLARMFHHSPIGNGNNKNTLRQHVAVSSKGAI